MQDTQSVMAIVSISTMVFDWHEGHAVVSPYNNPMRVELKVEKIFVHIILVDTESFAEIIT